MTDQQSGSSPPETPKLVNHDRPATAVFSFADASALGSGDPELWWRRIRHDIRHELGTIIMLASAVAVSDDVGAKSRQRVGALLAETRWLDHLLRQLDEDDGDRTRATPERLRVDDLVAEMVAGLRLSAIRPVGYRSRPAWAHIDPLALWRAVRNVLHNACRVARDRIEVAVTAESGWTVVEVEDDGPGFGAGHGGLGLGLGIVHDLISGYGGSLEIRRRDGGGARVRVLLPSAAPRTNP